MIEWTAIAVMPNVEVREPVDGKIAALVGHDDPRLRALRRAQRPLDRFLRRFSDAFGESLRPAVLIARTDAPRPVAHVDAVASFRDVIALSAVCYNRALEINHPQGHRFTYANSFWLYPWMIDRDGGGLAARTPAFRGQSAPEIPHKILVEADLDLPLLEVLLGRWRERYADGKRTWPLTALFRSLNMANEAAMMPGGIATTFYDVGRIIALWVSAFEILVHPGPSGKADLGKVYDLLDKAEILYRLTTRRLYKCQRPRRDHADERRPVHSWLYSELNKARNDFLHGNKVEITRLNLKPSGRNLFQFAAPLYRLALTAFLPLPLSIPIPSLSDAARYGEALARELEFHSYQQAIEKALLLSRGIDLDRDMRERRRARRRS